MSTTTVLGWAVVVKISDRRPGLLELICAPDDGSDPVPALAFTELVGLVAVGDRVVINTAALHAGLGTGGFALVVAPERHVVKSDQDACQPSSPLPNDPVTLDPTPTPTPPPHRPSYLVKARYTPLQVLTQGVDEQTSPHHDSLREANSLDGMVVVTADLHSALPAIIAGAAADGPLPRIAYIMSDAGALPLAMSRSVAELRETGLLTCTITAGQAFGGDYEAVTIQSALLAAHLVAEAEIAIIAPGPGNLGTGTRWGFSGVAVGEAINAASILGGRPIGCLRVSGADPRPRHQGLSHHSVTAYGRVALRPADLVFPDLTDQTELPSSGVMSWVELAKALDAAAANLTSSPNSIHRRVNIPVDGLFEALRHSPTKLNTMGRDLSADPAFFLAAAAAGRHAGQLGQ